MEQVPIVQYAIEHVWLVTGDQTIIVWHVKLIALYLGPNAYAIQVKNHNY